MKRGTRRALIIGGSIGGLFAGLALRQRGWDVQIHESTSALDGRGAGITTHEGVFNTLDSLGIEDSRSIGLPIETRKTFAINGAELGSYRMPQLVTSWGRLHRVLLDAFPDSCYHRNSIYSHHEPIAEPAWTTAGSSSGVSSSGEGGTPGVGVTFASGDTVEASLLVAADGIRSSVRSRLFASVQPEYAGYIAWRGMIDEADLDKVQRETLLPYFSFCLPAGEQLLAYPVAGSDHTSSVRQRRLNVVWYRPADATELQHLLTDIDGQNNGVSIAPDRVRPEAIQIMKDAAGDRLSPQHAALIEAIEKPFIQPIYDVMSAQIISTRVALLGDAAFTARPHLGMGVTKAAEDAMSLATSLEVSDHGEGIQASLERYQQQRLPVGQLIVQRSRQLGAYLQGRLIQVQPTQTQSNAQDYSSSGCSAQSLSLIHI